MRFVVLLLITIVFFSSCKNDHPEIPEEVKQSEPEWVMSDSITFKVELAPEESLLLNLEDQYFDHFLLEWENESDKDSVFTITIPRYHKVQKIDYGYGMWDSIQKKASFINQDFIIDSITDLVHLKVLDRKIELVDQKSTMDISEMENAYEDLRAQIYKWKGDDTKFIKPLDSLSNYYDSMYSKESAGLNRTLNEFEYFDKLHGIDPELVPLDSLLRSTDLMIARSAGPSLVFQYIDNNMDSIGFELMNPSGSSEASNKTDIIYERNLAYGVLRYLRYKDNKGNNLYPEARNWLKRTKFYQDNKEQIDSQIEQMDNTEFKKVLSNIELVDLNLDKVTMSQIIRENPSPYYLIDLWATWCAPCLNGMKLMKKMNFPENVTVISISIDYEKDTALWQEQSPGLDLELNYLMKIKGENSQKFIDFIQMKTIPRYLLMDKNMNIIDPAFYRPQEPQFLSKLKDVKNHTSW
ncbi:hypothetical protein AAU57_02305 [Nonlabens sp. YIK11]|uniref:TlpA family protein disulfide reductase n=1 Tax=Nonlabens sp. YIK11 TaxID=1453349 RepID=UPI0006DCE81F|nr:hypothetical protein [Nonlabens sp. YIK11]KQC32286.1 hypothetical protein AAU57_02305 [Nonlabens sp. YIK11]